MKKNMKFLVVLVLVACFLATMIVGCKDNTNPDTTGGATQGTPSVDPTGTTGAGNETNPTEETDDGAIEIILPNENDGEEGIEDEIPGDNGGQSDPFVGNTGSDNSGAGTDATTPTESEATEPTQGATGNGTAGGNSGSTDDDDETPDLVIDFEDIFGS